MKTAIIVTSMNHPFKIKICGVTSIKDAEVVAASDADAIGLNFYPKSKRFIDLPAATEITDALNKYSRESNKSLVLVGVFVNSSVREMIDIGEAVGLHTIQLHGDESPSIVGELIEATQSRGLAFDYIRAIRTAPGDSKSPLDKSEVDHEIQRWVEAGVAAILIDAAVPGDFGGTGKQVDWAGFQTLSSSVPKLLAGGLTKENIQTAIETALPCGVDVASGVERSPREKDSDCTRQFAASAKTALAKTTKP